MYEEKDLLNLLAILFTGKYIVAQIDQQPHRLFASLADVHDGRIASLGD
jgi:hypothetical protein